MRSTSHCTAILVIAAVACLTAALQARAGETDLIVDERRVIDPDSGYSFSVPDGWRLTDESRPGLVGVVHDQSGASFSVGVKSESSDLETEFKMLALALPFQGGRWSRISDGSLKIGKKRAREIVSTRQFPNEELLYLRNFAVVHRGRAYLLSSSIPESKVEQLTSDIDGLLNSFVWEKKSKPK